MAQDYGHYSRYEKVISSNRPAKSGGLGRKATSGKKLNEMST
jgi:hypothetical protein